MSTPSTTSYLPLDSDAPSAFSSAQMGNYVCIAFVMLLLYDHIITLDKEIEWIWTLRWRLPKIIFLINRYALTFLITLSNIPETMFPLPLSFCVFMNNLVGWSPILNICAAELLMMIRVYSLYSHRKLIIWTLGSLFVFAFISTAVTEVLFMHTYFTALYYDLFPGCVIWIDGNSVQWHVWIPSLSFEGALMLLTLYKIISYRNEMNRTITVLSRDSMVYFVITFIGLAVVVANSIHEIAFFSILVPIQCIISIAVGRMMMNIRGLALDDPEHTTHLHTLRFVVRPNTDTEIEEVP